MFRVLLADDEPAVTQHLKEMIPWQELGLELAGIAADGEVLLGLAREGNADIVIMDIRMPHLDGLEACKALRRQNTRIQFIIISGYAEFSYAQKAIKYGVLEYCLKPLDESQIREALLKAIHKLQESVPAQQNEDFPEALENEAFGAAREMIEGCLGICGSGYYVAVATGEERLPFDKREVFEVELGLNQYGYISSVPYRQEQLEGYFHSPKNLGIGYQRKAVGAEGLHAAFSDCVAMSCHYFMDGRPQAVSEEDDFQADGILEEILGYVQKKNWGKVCERLVKIKEQDREAFTVRSAMKLCNTIYSGSLFREGETDYYIYSLQQLVKEYGSFEGMLQQLQKQITMQGTKGRPETVSVNQVFFRLIKYINEEYQSNISISSASECFNLNPNYIGQLFKKEAGLTFGQYLTQLRIGKAKEMLRQTQDTVMEISVGVGYHDYFHFMKVFKKHTGKTPTQYRMGE